MFAIDRHQSEVCKRRLLSFVATAPDTPIAPTILPPASLRAGLGEDATLDHVFRHYTGDTLDKTPEEGGIRDVRRTRRTARRLG